MSIVTRALSGPTVAGSRSMSTVGTGGRSSFSGIVATIFGSSGFAARYVVSKLGRIGSQVVTPYRGEDTDVRHLRTMGDLGQIVPLHFDARDQASVEECMKRSNLVINLIGRPTATSNWSLTETHVEVAQTIAKAANAVGVDRLIHVSSLSASSDAPDEWSRAKFKGEQAVRAEFPEAVVLRPAPLVGHEDIFTNRIADRIKMAPIAPLWDGGEAKVQPMLVTDFSEAVLRCASDFTTDGRTFDLAGPKVYTMEQMVDLIMQAGALQATKVPAPASLVAKAVSIVENTPYMPINSTEVQLQARDIIMKAKGGNEPIQALGFEPENIEEKLYEFLRRLRPGGHFTEVDQKFNR